MKKMALSAVPLLLALHAPTVLAQAASSYPSKPIRYLVGYTPAGTADMLARAVGQKLHEAWGQQVIVENRPGGGTNIATDMGAKAPPDGYTLFMPTVANAINPTLYAKLNHDLLRDFAFVTNFAKVPGIVVCHPSVPVKNVKELAALARANPNSLRHGSTGIGSPHHLAAEIFKSMTGVKMIHVPYKGSGPAMQDVMGGQVNSLFDQFPSSKQAIDGGKLKAIGVISPRRIPGYDVMTMEEAGMKGFTDEAWYGILAPKGTPADVVAKLNDAVKKLAANAEFRAAIEKVGARPVLSSPADFAAQVKSEIDRMKKLVQDRQIKLDE